LIGSFRRRSRRRQKLSIETWPYRSSAERFFIIFGNKTGSSRLKEVGVIFFRLEPSTETVLDDF
jgi:hypothetical protein